MSEQWVYFRVRTSKPAVVLQLLEDRKSSTTFGSTVRAADIVVEIAEPPRVPLRTGQRCKSPGCSGQLVVKDSRPKSKGSEWYRKVYHCNTCALVHGAEIVHWSEIRGHGNSSRS